MARGKEKRKKKFVKQTKTSAGTNIRKSGEPKDEKNEPSPFHFLRT
jgi:hypothetical protein